MGQILNDHDDFTLYGDHLKNKKIAFVVTGGIAAYTAPNVIRALRRYSCEVFPYVTEQGLKFVTKDALEWASKHKAIKKLTNKSEHLGQDNTTFDAIVVYAATYDFIGKMANGIADDAASSLIASHISHAPILIIPTMHGNMWNSPIFQRNLQSLIEFDNIEVIGPRLENNKANVPDTTYTVCKIVRALSNSKLRYVKILVTAGPTPVKIDNVRRITNKFSGKLGVEIANELWLRGANVFLIQSYSGVRPPSYIPHFLHEDYDQYKQKVLELCNEYDYGIFSAAVADYKPKEVVEGKIPSKGAIKSIELLETEKVIDLVLKKAPRMYMISFKYEEGKELKDLVHIAQDRLNSGHHRVVANDITLNENGEQKCFLCSKDSLGLGYIKETAIGKINIARMIANDIERSHTK